MQTPQSSQCTARDPSRTNRSHLEQNLPLTKPPHSPYFSAFLFLPQSLSKWGHSWIAEGSQWIGSRNLQKKEDPQKQLPVGRYSRKPGELPHWKEPNADHQTDVEAKMGSCQDLGFPMFVIFADFSEAEAAGAIEQLFELKVASLLKTEHPRSFQRLLWKSNR